MELESEPTPYIPPSEVLEGNLWASEINEKEYILKDFCRRGAWTIYVCGWALLPLCLIKTTLPVPHSLCLYLGKVTGRVYMLTHEIFEILVLKNAE